VELGGDQSAFSPLKTAEAADGEHYRDGVYLSVPSFKFVELMYSDVDASDFFVPNGAFNGETFELHSLITDSRLKGDASAYLAAASERPPSETEGKPELDILGQVFTNLPSPITGYIRRSRLEDEICAVLMDDRHPVVTLVGRGGIGKTSLAITALRKVAETDRFVVILWFSARDIDLMTSGAKPVKPQVLSDREIAEQYRKLVGSSGGDPKVAATQVMAEHLRKNPLGATLFVFDNFETVRSPVDLFNWIDTNIRLPNKIMITTRFREFKADYPIEVSGMEYDEANALVTQTAASLGISSIIGRNETDLLIEESDGHPYVIKIILGEIANSHTFSKPSGLMARKEEILNALFERTYAHLSPIASRIFLTLCGWRSLVPQLAVEAVLLRYGSEGVSPDVGIDQLVRMSLVERRKASDNADFIEVPLAAALFGRRKLEVNPHRQLIESDIRFLQDVGATAGSGLKEGLRPRVETFFRRAARKLSDKNATLTELRPVLEFFARGYAPAWLLLSELEQENSDLSRAAECIRRYLESHPSAAQAEAAWQKLVSLYRTTGDVIGGCGAFLKAAEITIPPLDEISAMANWLNTAPKVREEMDIGERAALCRPLARLMEGCLSEASATDLSRLSWLYLHSGDENRALDVADLGLEREPDNIYCERLVAKLRVPG
jgi:tetratricopeptide (TPR) repeat protein